MGRAWAKAESRMERIIICKPEFLEVGIVLNKEVALGLKPELSTAALLLQAYFIENLGEDYTPEEN
jgi:hypothetical protein